MRSLMKSFLIAGAFILAPLAWGEWPHSQQGWIYNIDTDTGILRRSATEPLSFPRLEWTYTAPDPTEEGPCAHSADTTETITCLKLEETALEAKWLSFYNAAQQDPVYEAYRTLLFDRINDFSKIDDRIEKYQRLLSELSAITIRDKNNMQEAKAGEENINGDIILLMRQRNSTAAEYNRKAGFLAHIAGLEGPLFVINNLISVWQDWCHYELNPNTGSIHYTLSPSVGEPPLCPNLASNSIQQYKPATGEIKWGHTVEDGLLRLNPGKYYHIDPDNQILLEPNPGRSQKAGESVAVECAHDTSTEETACLETKGINVERGWVLLGDAAQQRSAYEDYTALSDDRAKDFSKIDDRITANRRLLSQLEGLTSQNTETIGLPYSNNFELPEEQTKMAADIKAEIHNNIISLMRQRIDTGREYNRRMGPEGPLSVVNSVNYVCHENWNDYQFGIDNSYWRLSSGVYGLSSGVYDGVPQSNLNTYQEELMKAHFKDIMPVELSYQELDDMFGLDHYYHTLPVKISSCNPIIDPFDKTQIFTDPHVPYVPYTQVIYMSENKDTILDNVMVQIPEEIRDKPMRIYSFIKKWAEESGGVYSLIDFPGSKETNCATMGAHYYENNCLFPGDTWKGIQWFNGDDIINY